MSTLIEIADLPPLIAEAAAASKLDLAAGSYRLVVMAGTCVIDEQRSAARVESIAAEWRDSATWQRFRSGPSP